MKQLNINITFEITFSFSCYYNDFDAVRLTMAEHKVSRELASLCKSVDLKLNNRISEVNIPFD